MTWKNCYSLAAKLSLIYRIPQILQLQISAFGFYRILLMKKIILQEDCERHLDRFFAQKETKGGES